MNNSDINKATTKKKGPPEFRHLPRDRAKKLKKEWIEKKKIKARWRHERKQDNLAAPHLTEAVQDLEQEAQTESVSLTGENTATAAGYAKIQPPPIHSSKKMKPKRNSPHDHKPEETTNKALVINSKAPQINRTSRVRDTDKKRRSTDQSKKVYLTGNRRPVTMREKMGSLLEKIQKTMSKEAGT